MVTLLREERVEAIRLFEDVPRLSVDPWLVYLASFFRGKALTALGRNEEAATAYRNALSVKPRSHSAQISLAALLFLNDRRSEASSIVRTVLSESDDATDPWAWYPYGDLRHLDQRLRDVREAVR